MPAAFAVAPPCYHVLCCASITTICSARLEPRARRLPCLHSVDFATTMGNEGGPTNAAPYVIGGGQADGFAFGLLFNSPSFGGMKFTESAVTLSTAPDRAGGGNTTIRKVLDLLVTTSAKGSAPPARAFDIQQVWSRTRTRDTSSCACR
eukprot:SAG22_NODE_404_length_11005_cov_8.751788_3_plen_149_part_00